MVIFCINNSWFVDFSVPCAICVKPCRERKRETLNAAKNERKINVFKIQREYNKMKAFLCVRVQGKERKCGFFTSCSEMCTTDTGWRKKFLQKHTHISRDQQLNNKIIKETSVSCWPRCFYCLSLVCTFQIVIRAMNSPSLSSLSSQEAREKNIIFSVKFQWKEQQNHLHCTYCNCKKVKKGSNNNQQMMARISFFCHSTSRTSNWFIFIYNVIFTPFLPFKCAAIVPFSLRCFFSITFPTMHRGRREATTQVLWIVSSDFHLRKRWPCWKVRLTHAKFIFFSFDLTFEKSLNFAQFEGIWRTFTIVDLLAALFQIPAFLFPLFF